MQQITQLDVPGIMQLFRPDMSLMFGHECDDWNADKAKEGAMCRNSARQSPLMMPFIPVKSLRNSSTLQNCHVAIDTLVRRCSAADVGCSEMQTITCKPNNVSVNETRRHSRCLWVGSYSQPKHFNKVRIPAINSGVHFVIDKKAEVTQLLCGTSSTLQCRSKYVNVLFWQLQQQQYLKQTIGAKHDERADIEPSFTDDHLQQPNMTLNKQ
ncbi:hypothetical protein TELCIR_02117 [Teladorsagia circumcincta]|uniref:Uncharacterized protein n=1 Tax=Teladorsagia circumcincta TaxID=45464 RepID=A0A2G9UZY5_TELCI|nr:hypothetical protein TELCIR_02117 [Teladorsagia circumcincta]